MIDIASRILQYLKTLDESLEKLSNKNEGKITGLPGWTLARREINIGFTPDGQGVVIKIVPDNNLNEDTVSTKSLTNDEDLKNFMDLLQTECQIKQLSQATFFLISEMLVINAKNPLAPPVLDHSYLFGSGNINDALQMFTTDSAKKDALNFWNAALHEGRNTSSYIHEVKVILEKFKHLIKRKAFLERRIHRFIKEHPRILLPNYTRYFFEYHIYYDNEIRKADFVLEREVGLPPLLIELESPVHKIFRKNGELTAEANHAKNQIAEWVSFIDRDTKRNASGEFSFLSGTKQRLVIIGRGLEHKEKLLCTKFSDTVIWTYDLLLDQARSRLNNEIVAQCKLIGMEELRPF